MTTSVNTTSAAPVLTPLQTVEDVAALGATAAGQPVIAGDIMAAGQLVSFVQSAVALNAQKTLTKQEWLSITSAFTHAVNAFNAAP